MATTFKTLTANDVTNTRTLLHEAIPLTGTIVSGTYADQNVKTFTHGMFESTFDYPYLSSSANHILDITHGYSSNSILSGTGGSLLPQQKKKINIYNQMAAVLVGHDENGAIQRFDQDGDIAGGGQKLDEVFFVNFSRLLVKDEIKKGSFTINFLTGGTPSDATPNPAIKPQILGDYGAATSYLVNSPAGEYGLLYSSSADAVAGFSPQGLLYYQAGIAVITGSAFSSGSTAAGELALLGIGGGGASGSYSAIATSASIDVMAACLRNRLANISFNNTVELNSTIYFCRANNNEFNYSSNPTYLNSSEIRVKNTTSDNPVAYITTVGLYSSDNELLAVAKLSEPLKKDPNTELTIRVRLDY
jgi:hypothetical protein